MKHGDKIKQAALDAGVSLWAAGGREAVTALGVGKAIGLTHGGILYHFGTSGLLREAVACEAVRVGNASVIRQLIAMNDPAVKDMPGHIKSDYWCAAI